MLPGSYYTDHSGSHYRCSQVTGQKVTLLRLGEPMAKFYVAWNHTHVYKEIKDPNQLEYLEKEYRKVKDYVEVQL